MVCHLCQPRHTGECSCLVSSTLSPSLTQTDGCCRLAQPGLPKVPALPPTSESCILAGASLVLPYQVCSQPQILSTRYTSTSGTLAQIMSLKPMGESYNQGPWYTKDTTPVEDLRREGSYLLPRGQSASSHDRCPSGICAHFQFNGSMAVSTGGSILSSGIRIPKPMEPELGETESTSIHGDWLGLTSGALYIPRLCLLHMEEMASHGC